MPKQFKTYTRFDGGLNTKTNSRSIQDNELAQATNVIVDEFGMVKSCGKVTDNTSDYTAPSLTATQAGYGLFQATFDFASGGGNTSTVRTFLADADDGTNAVVHVLDATTWDTNDISLGAVTSSEQAKVIYHIADGAVTTCDTNIANVSTTVKNYKYKKAESKWRSSSGASIMSAYNAGWKSYDTKLSPPTSGICGDQVAGTTAGSGNNTTTLIAVDSDAFEDFNTELDLGTYWAVRAGADTELITNRSSDTQLTMPGGGSTWGNSQLYYIYPPLGTGFTLDFTVASGGSWAAGTYEFATTFVYDGNQESLLKKIDGDMTVSEDDKVTCRVAVVENNDGTGFPLNIMGGRIYCKIKDSDDSWVLFGDISFKGHSNKGGSRSSLDGDYTYWASAVGGTDNSYLYTTFISESLSVETYQSINGFSPDSAFNSIGAAGEKYQTSVVTNRRAFVANIQYTTDGGNLQNFGDQIRYSEINKFSTFPPFNFIDIGVNDGEEFVKLEAFADRLLAFKEKTLYIINIGGGSDTQWFLESEHKNMGVLFHAAVSKTDFGVAWANPNGLFFYDGSQIVNLQTKIKEEDWKGMFSPSFYAQSFVDATCDYNDDPTITMDSTAKVIPGMLVSGSGIPTGSTVSSVTDATDFELSASTTGGSKTNQTLTFHANKTILFYEPTNKHLGIIKDCSGASGTDDGIYSTEGYMFSFITKSFTLNTGVASNEIILTNPIIDYKNNVAIGAGLDEIETYDGESNITTTILHFKNDDFGLPDVVKKIYGITVEYSTDQNQDSALTYRITDSSGTSNSSFVGSYLSSTNLDDTNNDLDVKRFTFTSPISVASLQLKLRFGSSATLHTVNRVSVEYRPLYKRIT